MFYPKKNGLNGPLQSFILKVILGSKDCKFDEGLKIILKNYCIIEAAVRVCGPFYDFPLSIKFTFLRFSLTFETNRIADNGKHSFPVTGI
jgi:hypothetical protein